MTVSAYLYKERNAVQTTNDSSVVSLSGQNMQGSNCSLYYFLHANTINIPWSLSIGADRGSLKKYAGFECLWIQLRLMLWTTANIQEVSCTHKSPTLCVSWWALMRRWTILGRAPCSLSGAWFAGQRARFLMRPTTALMRGHLLGGWSNLTRTGRP